MVVLIPSYEPTEKLLSLINEINMRALTTIIIVDDGSGESYAHIFNDAVSMGCIVLHHDINQGKGAALKTGFKYIQSQHIREQIVCADSDGQHKAIDIIRVGNYCQSNDMNIILGSRAFKGHVPLRSKIGNHITAFVFKITTDINLPDTQTGLRSFSPKLIPWLLNIEGDRFEYEFNMLLQAKSDHIEMIPVNISTIYLNQNKHSHFRPIKDSLSIYMPLLKFSASSITAGILDFVIFFIILGLSQNLFASVVLARIISAVYNYSINRFIVFKHPTNKMNVTENHAPEHSAPKYFSLVAVIMLLNYLLLSVMTGHLSVPDLPAKLLTEITLFLISYTVQKHVIFNHNKNISMHSQAK